MKVKDMTLRSWLLSNRFPREIELKDLTGTSHLHTSLPKSLRPPPYRSPWSPGSPPLVKNLLATKRSLSTQISQLKDVITLQKELKDLAEQVQTLQADLMDPPVAARHSGKTSKNPTPVKGRQSISFSFPVITRSGSQRQDHAGQVCPKYRSN